MENLGPDLQRERVAQRPLHDGVAIVVARVLGGAHFDSEADAHDDEYGRHDEHHTRDDERHGGVAFLVARAARPQAPAAAVARGLPPRVLGVADVLPVALLAESGIQRYYAECRVLQYDLSRVSVVVGRQRQALGARHTFVFVAAHRFVGTRRARALVVVVRDHGCKIARTSNHIVVAHQHPPGEMRRVFVHVLNSRNVGVRTGGAGDSVRGNAENSAQREDQQSRKPAIVKARHLTDGWERWFPTAILSQPRCGRPCGRSTRSSAGFELSRWRVLEDQQSGKRSSCRNRLNYRWAILTVVTKMWPNISYYGYLKGRLLLQVTIVPKEELRGV